MTSSLRIFPSVTRLFTLLAVRWWYTIVAAIKALPAYDLKLLWAMYGSLALVVGAAAVKFGGKRPTLGELLDWAWDSVSSSLSSASSSPVGPR